MKILGRIFLILFAFALLMGLMYVAVNTASSSSVTSNAPAFERDQGAQPRPEGVRPPGVRGEHGGRGGGWMFGMIRNMGIVAIVVALIVAPKNLWRKRIRSISAGAG